MRGPVLLLLLTVGIYWKLVLSGGQYTWLNSPDLSTQVLPWFEFQAREWNRGQFPLWDPYNWGGQSLAGPSRPGGDLSAELDPVPAAARRRSDLARLSELVLCTDALFGNVV